MGGIVAVTVVVVVLLFELLFEGAGDVNDVVKLLVCGDVVVAIVTEAGGLDPPAPIE